MNETCSARKCITVAHSGEQNVHLLEPCSPTFDKSLFIRTGDMANIIAIKLQLDPAAYNRALVPDNFDVPTLLQTNRLRLRLLTIHDAVRDFDAVVLPVKSACAPYTILGATGRPD